MKKLTLYQIVCFAIILSHVHSCNSVNQEIVKDENGNIISKCKLKNGVRHGKCYHYYPNGSVKMISNWIEGTRDGESIEYCENKSVHSTTMWKDGKINGEVVKFFESGNIQGKLFYINNLLIEHKFYDEDGRLLKIANYIIINQRSELNGIVVFASHDADGSPDKINFQETAVAHIFADRDTIDYGSFVEYEMEWMCNSDFVRALTGDINHNFNVIDSTTMKWVDLENKNRFYPKNLGTDTLRVIFDFMKIEDEKELIFTSYLEKVFTVIEKK